MWVYHLHHPQESKTANNNKQGQPHDTRKVWKSGGGTRINVVSLISPPPGWDRVTDLKKLEGGSVPLPPAPRTDPVLEYVQN